MQCASVLCHYRSLCVFLRFITLHLSTRALTSIPHLPHAGLLRLLQGGLQPPSLLLCLRCLLSYACRCLSFGPLLPSSHVCALPQGNCLVIMKLLLEYGEPKGG